MVVKTYNPEHKCPQTRSVKAFTAEYMSNEILMQIESNPCIPLQAIQEQMNRKFEMKVSRMKALRVKTQAMDQVMSDYVHQYSILRDYGLELIRTNPGTKVKIEVESEPNPASETRVFKRIYICLGPLKQGFKACKRDLIGLDDAFMKGSFIGQLLTTVGVDPNNEIYLVAYAIVMAGNSSSWSWFLDNLGEDLELQPNCNFTFISDRQKGTIPTLSKKFPSAEHRFCLRHIHQNMKLKWRGKAFKDILWSIATATTIQEFQSKMEDLKAMNVEAYKWLRQIPHGLLTRSHFTGRSRSDMLLNNLCEVLNSKLVDGRYKPVISALEHAREYLMKRIVNVLKIIEKTNGLLTPTIEKKFEIIKNEATKLIVKWNGGSKYKVTGTMREQSVVDVFTRACTCRR